jgi:hypothetical protein
MNPSGNDDWRDYGAAMALESPFLDSDIVVARAFEKDSIDPIIQRFPGRLVLYQAGDKIDTNVDSLYSADSQGSK